MKSILFLISSLLMTTNVVCLTNSFLTKKDPPIKNKYKIKELPGTIDPIGFWDPLNITNDMDDRLGLYIREAEQQHGRVAMLSMIALPTLDILDRSELAINYYNDFSNIFISKELFVGVFLTEIARIFIQYEYPGEKLFRLKKDVYPGNLFNYDISNIKDTLIEKELANGRLAMLTSVFYISQELITNHKII